MRPLLSLVSQFGMHEWLIQRASFPPTPASTTLPSSSEKKNVCCGFFGSCAGSFCAFSQEIRSPVYSMMRAPLRIFRAAKTPFPCTPEFPTLTFFAGASREDFCGGSFKRERQYGLCRSAANSAFLPPALPAGFSPGRSADEWEPNEQRAPLAKAAQETREIGLAQYLSDRIGRAKWL